MTRKKPQKKVPQKRVPENESSQDRFRRVIAQRLKPIRKYTNMLESMTTQPSYDINSHDAQLVIDELKSLLEPTIAAFEKARNGDIKAKEIAKYQGIDWSKELEDKGEDEPEDKPEDKGEEN